MGSLGRGGSGGSSGRQRHSAGAAEALGDTTRHSGGKLTDTTVTARHVPPLLARLVEAGRHLGVYRVVRAFTQNARVGSPEIQLGIPIMFSKILIGIRAVANCYLR